MEFFLDTVNVEKIKKYNEKYNITGVTSNPTIFSREQCEFFPTLIKIREIIGDKQLHVQVTGKTCEEMLKEAQTIVNRIDKNVYIKVPTNEEGIKITVGDHCITLPLNENNYNAIYDLISKLRETL